jgi:hypothetical protein
MELADMWLNAQRGTPSFVSGGNFGVVDVDRGGGGGYTSILDAPLPAGLLNITLGKTTTLSAARAYHGRESPRLGHQPVHRRVHDELLAKGKLYQQQREARQEKAIRDELKQLRAPKISAEARNMHHNEPFHKRIARVHEQKEVENAAKLHKLMKEDEEEQKKRNTFMPKISARGKRATGKINMILADQHEQYQSRREEQMEAERAKRIVDELQEVRDGPEINPRSQRLATQRREREGLAGLGHAEAMLERDRLAKLALWERQQKELIMSSNPNPRITMYAATLDRGGEDVSDRLYRAAFEAAERKAEKARVAVEEGHRSPMISHAARRSASRSQRIEDDLMERHLQSLAQKERAVMEEARRQRHQHNPAINPVSDAIAAQLPMSSRERLSLPVRSASFADPNNMMAGAAGGGDYTHHHGGGGSVPRQSHTLTAPTARSMSAVSLDEREHAEILARQEERRRQRMEDIRREAEERELRECTFAPVTSPSSNRRRAATPTQSLADRAAQWAKKREAWVNEQQRAKDSTEIADCTFVPATHSTRDVTRALTPHRTIYGGEGKAWGTSEFVDRQRAARERHDDEKRRQTYTGSTWRNRPTVPDAPQLGRTERTHIRALERPIEPPRYGSAERHESYGSASPTQHRERSETPLPSPSHFSRMRHGSAHAMQPLVPFTLHEHRAALGRA